MRIIRASKSPRRRDILEMMGVKDFEVIPSSAREPDCGDMPPGEAVKAIASAKLAACPDYGPDALVITADTLVFCGSEHFGKPVDAQDARRMLRALSGRGHSVYSGVAVKYGGRTLCRFEKTDVYFRELSSAEIEAYIASGEPFDKAGAYAAQGRAAAFVERIDGDFWNVVGLPGCALGQMCRSLGANIL